MELILTGDAVDASHAKEIGLVNSVVPAADLRSAFAHVRLKSGPTERSENVLRARPRSVR